uniref:Stromal antigen n=1 Tax=Rhizophora mucronata TaxID=61149 RepID=A0A2P2M8D9_RHIMU
MHLSNKTLSNSGPFWHSTTRLSQKDKRLSLKFLKSFLFEL